MAFGKHGTYSVSITHNILFVDATGPFNRELVEAYKLDVESKISRLEGAEWGQVVTLNEQSLFTPDAEASLILSLYQRRNRGLAASAVVSKSPFRLVKAQIDSIYQAAGVEHAFFDNHLDAEYWLRALLGERIDKKELKI